MFKKIFFSCSSGGKRRDRRFPKELRPQERPHDLNKSYFYTNGGQIQNFETNSPPYFQTPSLGELKVGDRIVWLREAPDTNEAGVVKWLGVIEEEDIAGIEFDRRLGLGSGYYKNKQLFPCDFNHGGLVAVVGLILEEDYFNSVGPFPQSSFGGSLGTASPSPSPSSAGSFGPNSPKTYRGGDENQGFLTPGYVDQGPYHKSPIKTDSKEIQDSRTRDNNTTMPLMHIIYPPLKEEELNQIDGRMKGIQGHRNSCYLDATLFSMFSFSGVFDTILLTALQRKNNNEPFDEDLAKRVQYIMRDLIVSPLRKDQFTPADNVMKLRESLKHLDDKLISEEMDPQEFLQILFSNVMNLQEFLSLSSGESDYFHQVLVQPRAENDKIQVPSIQHLFEQSLIMQDLKLKAVPAPALILQMPRSGNKFKMFDGILPNLTIDITDLIENTPRTCIICGGLATHECPKCYGCFTTGGSSKIGGSTSSGAESTAFCSVCISKTHQRKERNWHKNSFTDIKYSFNPANSFPQLDPFRTRNEFDPNPSFNRNPVPSVPFKSIPRVKLDLFAVICIESSHFVSFVKTGTYRTAPWVFFDSMADRVENSNGTGHNIPQVKLLPKMGHWLDQLEHSSDKLDKKYLDSVSPDLRRLLSDPYICLYYSPQAYMYA